MQNANGEILLAISAKGVEPIKPRLCYAGGNKAVLFHSTQMVYLNGIHSEVQPALAAVKKILVTEVDGQNVVREYEAPVSIIPEKGLYEYGYSNLQIKNHPHDIDLFDRVLEFANNNIQLIGETLYQRGLAWFYLGKYADAIIDIHQVVVLTKGRDTEVVEHQKMIAEKILAEKMYGIEVKNENFPIPGLVPYYFHINNLKKFPQKTIKDVIGIDEMNNIAAALAAFEEYELLERYIAEGNSLNVQCDAYFVDWQPTPFYYVTTWKVFDNLNDAEKILRFLVKNGADPDMSSGENSTALWNATHSGVPIEKLKLLIELGCDVNKKSADGEFLWTPLINCLRQTSDENDETIALPPDEITLEKAKFLIENGADINDRVSGLTPLMFAICNCDHKDLDFIKFLLENGANPNVIDDFSYTLTPLLLTHDYDWFEAGQLFLLYGAETETMQKLLEKRANRHIESLTLTVQNSFKPGSGEDSETSKNYDLSEIEQLTPINFEYFNVYLSEKTPTKLSGKVIFDCPETGVIKDCGEFTLSLENKEFYTESINFTYDIHTQLTLQIQLSDISLEDEFADEITAKEQARRDAEFTQKLSDFQENKEQYLSGISEELKGDFTDFCINTELGQFFVNINAAEHAILYWFLVFGEPFKNITFRNRYDDVLQAIYHLDYEKDPDFRSEWSGYWQLFESVYNNYRKMKTDTQHTDQEILDQYNKAENACRESMRYLGDVAFVSVAACRYLQGDMFNSYGMDEQGAECKKECQSTLYNLSQRDDLFSEEQMQVLEILRGVVGEVL
ncbi:MAG: ankyrin repeat domain-containing protein [Proteiniphilum sp.]|nr:ankyrin repeat domain-containing protein [Proteiniphilum sp.]